MSSGELTKGVQRGQDDQGGTAGTRGGGVGEGVLMPPLRAGGAPRLRPAQSCADWGPGQTCVVPSAGVSRDLLTRLAVIKNH